MKKGDYMVNRNSFLEITKCIVGISLFLVLSIVFYDLILRLHYFYLFITIPMLFLFITITLENIIIMFFQISKIIFGRNDNTEVSEFIEKSIRKVKNISKYVLIGVFTALLTSVMILDIILCVVFEKYILVALSIVIWVLLYYMLFTEVIKMIKKEIRLQI